MTTMIVRAGIPCAHCKGCHPSMAAFNRCKETTRERNRRMMDDFEAMFSDDDEEPDEEGSTEEDENNGDEPDWEGEGE